MKKWLFIPTVLILVAVIYFILPKSCFFKTMTSDELNAAIEITDVETKWVEKHYQAWPPKLTLVPAISFRIKNISDSPVNYINFNAIFRFQDDYENLGDAFMAAIREKSVLPGEKSDLILLKSNYGVEGRTVESFNDNPAWRIVNCKLFAQSKGSTYIALGEYQISRTIDFKEPEPVTTEQSNDKKGVEEEKS